MNNLDKKYESLISLLRSFGGVAVAFSGGVDSTFLAYAANEALGENALAITLSLYSTPESEQNEAKEFCKKYGINHKIIKMNELLIEGFSDNPPNRCYICKKALFTQMKKTAIEEGYRILVDGSNTDDLSDYRPGMKALKELEIRSPLEEVGYSKEEIRMALKKLGLKIWEKPSAACLSSRFAYGQTITKEKLKMVEQAEEYLKDKGFLPGLRVRIHDDLARIELDLKDITKAMELPLRDEIYDKLKSIGFTYVTIDMKGYRMGSMNEVLSRKKAIIFDLDGTLLDTVKDLHAGVNYVLEKYNEPLITLEDTKHFVGNGNRRLIARSLRSGEEHPRFQEIFDDFVNYYLEHSKVHTTVYDGIEDMLRECKKKGIGLAVLSNKFHSATVDMIEHYFPNVFNVVYGDRKDIPRKPDPTSLIMIADELGVNVSDALYVGDSFVDSDTAENAGMDCVLVNWGFGEKHKFNGKTVKEIIDNPKELLKYI